MSWLHAPAHNVSSIREQKQIPLPSGLGMTLFYGNSGAMFLFDTLRLVPQT